jgi:hypothetical protein
MRDAGGSSGRKKRGSGGSRIIPKTKPGGKTRGTATGKTKSGGAASAKGKRNEPAKRGKRAPRGKYYGA